MVQQFLLYSVIFNTAMARGWKYHVTVEHSTRIGCINNANLTARTVQLADNTLSAQLRVRLPTYYITPEYDLSMLFILILIFFLQNVRRYGNCKLHAFTPVSKHALINMHILSFIEYNLITNLLDLYYLA